MSGNHEVGRHKSDALLRLTLLLVLFISFANLPVTVHAGSPDLTIDSIWLEDTSQIGQPLSQLSAGQSFNIIATIKNIGQDTASGYYLDVYYDSDYGRGGPDTIVPGESQVWYVGPLTAQAGTHSTTWIVDPDNQIAELDESNNQKQYTFTIGSQTTTTTTSNSTTTSTSETTTSTTSTTSSTLSSTTTSTSTSTSSRLDLAISAAYNSTSTLGFELTRNIYDNSGAGYMASHRSGSNVVFTLNDATRVNAGSHQLTFTDYGNAVLVGGRLANPTVGFYEDNGFAPLAVVVNANGTVSILHQPERTVALNVPFSSLDASNDYFVMECLNDAGHTVVILYGITQWGTLASGVYFDMQFPNLANLSQGSYVIHWQDSDSNGTPDPADTFMVVFNGT